MKNLIVLIVLSTTVVCCNEHELKEKDVPASVKEAFKKQFPEAKEVEWNNEEGKFEASYEQNNKEMSTVFSAAGVAEETEIEIKKEELPAAALTYISQNYKDAKINETAKITKANGEINFEAEVKKTDLIFDANGNFLLSKDVKEEDKD